MAATIIGFRWLDLLEKEFDKSYIDLEYILGDVANVIETISDVDDHEVFGSHAKNKMAALSSCFAQLAHKSQTIFQINAKLEAEIVNLKHDLSQSQASSQVIKSENEEILLKLHSAQIQLQKQNSQSVMLDVKYLDNIHKKIIEDITARREKLLNSQAKKEELVLLHKENEILKRDLISLQGDLCGAKLTTKYLDKELSGRIQQLQLLHKHIEGDKNERLWKQLESEIQLQRHKTIVRACRKNIINNMETIDSVISSEESSLPRPVKKKFHRFVTLERKCNEELGITITGGVDHGIPILISALNCKSIAGLTDQIYIGDAILSVNGVCLREATQERGASVLSSQKGNITLELVFIPSDEEVDTDLLPDDITNRYKIFDDDVLSLSSSLQLVQNGRLSRASIESIRGSTENILDSLNNVFETEKYCESDCTNSEKKSTISENDANSVNYCTESELIHISNHILPRQEIESNDIQNLTVTDEAQKLLGLPCDTTFDCHSNKNLHKSELFSYEY